jgi:DNA modification methylase
MAVELLWDGKYLDAERKIRKAPLKLNLPFQTVETINESVQERQKNLFASASQSDWRNRLIWGDKRYVLPSLLNEFAGKVNLIYIDPPFDTGANFSFQVEVEGEQFTKEPSIIEQKAYRDTWGKGLDSYLQWFYETALVLRELLHETGSIYVHLDWHVGHYAKAVLDEVFGIDNFQNEIVWYYYNKFQGNINRFASNHDLIFWYKKSAKYTFNQQREEREKATKQIKRVWDKDAGKIVNAKGEDGKVLYQEATHRTIDDVWRLSMLQPADQTENVSYPTQKPETILERIIKASSNENDLVLDCFCGSGTTAAVAEKLGRRWITCDLGRFAIHTARKRLLSIADVKPFVVQNLGKYERQAWQKDEFGENATARIDAYNRFILELYNAQPLTNFAWLHGIKQGRVVHIGAVDSPVTLGDVKAIILEWRKNLQVAENSGIDVLAWEFSFEINEIAKQQAKEAGVDMRFLQIPREVLEKKAVEQGDIQFFELAALFVDTKIKKKDLTVELTNFIAPLDYVPQEIRAKITDWKAWIDYWAIDFDFKGDTFHNQWQSYRTRKNKKLEVSRTHTYTESGKYTIQIKVIDILGNDTTKTMEIEVE